MTTQQQKAEKLAEIRQAGADAADRALAELGILPMPTAAEAT